MSDDDRFLEAMIGLGVWQAVAAARQNAEYQRQQLNLLRRHQGLPPIPPDRPSHSIAGTLLLTAWSLGALAGTAAGIFVADFGIDGPYPWGIGIAVTWFLCGRASWLFRSYVERADDAFYESWRRAGCP